VVLREKDPPGLVRASRGGKDDFKGQGPKITTAAAAPQASPIYMIRLRPERGDGIRALRAILKTLLRRYGIRALSIEEERR
jgi:hypothetical protein